MKKCASSRSSAFQTCRAARCMPTCFATTRFFRDGRISGVFDFYFAGVDCFVYDLAVCVNDWCLVDPEHDRRLDALRTQALLAAYAAARPLQPAERAAGRRCCAPLRCASGFPACTTSICRAAGNW